LLACVESYTLLQLDRPDFRQFFQRRADWLAHHQESGRLSNHQALIVLCLELLARLLKTNRWDAAKAQRLEQVLSWQDSEGWFQEYEGCDPGYHTLTVSCLAWVYALTQAQLPHSTLNTQHSTLKEAIAKAIHLAQHFVHPDGSYGGEYTSRNTYNFFPYGFELAGQWFPEALAINDRFLKGLAAQKEACYADDHIIGHHTWNYLLAWRDFVAARPPLRPRTPERIWLPNARILIDRREHTELYLALNKGGVFKLFEGDRLLCSDTQFSLQVQSGNKLKNAVGHLVGSYEMQVERDRILIQGNLGWAKQKQMTPLNLLILRAVMFTVGRFFPNLIRSLLQKVLITGKKPAPFRFVRQFQWQPGDNQGNGYWQLTDELHAQSWQKVTAAGIGCDQTSIYVVMSRTFQSGQLQPWLDLTDTVKHLPDGEVLRVERSLTR
ncbi:MAG: hypothetical protein VKJ64_11840, partial [Leptolyngbyaceae bacterium]|nr:hypothetical protein [Leptolyngbyaceae bacterium]